MMDGQIGVRSQEGRGSTFWVTVALRHGVGRASRRSNQRPVASARQPWRILVAEDNAVNQIVVRKMLEKLGYQVDAVGNGLEVLSAVKAAPYDLILMDCQMPEMDGYEAAETIRREKLGTRPDVPIIAFTAAAMKGDEERCFAAGMDDYVSKPIRNEFLAEKIEKWLN